MPKRVYGTGSIVERRTKAGMITLYGRWRRADGVKVKVRLGVKRTPSYADGLTKAQAEQTLRSVIEEDRRKQASRPVAARAGRSLGLSIAPKDGNGMLSSEQVMWPDDIARLIDAACDGPYRLVDRALYAAAAMSGLRKGECLGLRWRDVDFAGGRIRVRTQLARGDVERAPKSGEGRPVPMAGTVAAALLDLRDASAWTRPDNFVFADPSSGRRLAWTPTRRRYLLALKDAGLERFSRFHDLRHSFASALAKAGRPERQIQEWCGHSSPTVTRRYMRSFAPEEAADLEAVDAAFRGGRWVST
jgi:hypothetical protein